jgi:hypothetical protein
MRRNVREQREPIPTLALPLKGRVRKGTPALLRYCTIIISSVISTAGRNLNIKILRFLTFVRNDILPYHDTVTKGRGGLETKRPLSFKPRGLDNYPGNVLFSHTATHAVHSALKGLTSEFGMGSGVSPLPWSPGT